MMHLLCQAMQQVKCKETIPKFVRVHCYGYCFNLVSFDSIGKDNRVTYDFFGTIQLVDNLIESSCEPHVILENISTSMTIKFKTFKTL